MHQVSSACGVLCPVRAARSSLIPRRLALTHSHSHSRILDHSVQNGKYTAASKSIASSSCTDSACVPGKYCNANINVDINVDGGVESCPSGSYSDVDGLSFSSQCKSCTPGRRHDELARTSFVQCGECQGGRYSNRTRNSASSCADRCPAGKYKSTTGMRFVSQCSDECAAGRYSAATGYGASASRLSLRCVQPSLIHDAYHSSDSLSIDAISRELAVLRILQQWAILQRDRLDWRGPVQGLRARQVCGLGRLSALQSLSFRKSTKRHEKNCVRRLLAWAVRRLRWSVDVQALPSGVVQSEGWHNSECLRRLHGRSMGKHFRRGVVRAVHEAAVPSIQSC